MPRLDTENWTTVLAVLGSVTGVAGLSWQLLNYRLTGGRIQLYAIKWRSDDGYWQIKATATNVGRQDVTVIGYSVWPQSPESWRNKAAGKLKALRVLARKNAGRDLISIKDSVHIRLFGTLESDGVEVTLPAILKAGSVVAFPKVGYGVDRYQDKTFWVAVLLGSGRVVRVKAPTFRESEVERGVFIGHPDEFR